MKAVKELPEIDRPREKLVKKGPEALTDQELIAVLLGSGIKGKNVFHLAREILTFVDKDKGRINISTLLSIEGIGFARACQLAAAMEFARRRIVTSRTVIRTAGDVIPLLAYIADKKQEYLVCVTLNGACEVIDQRIITMGLVDTNQVHPREVFADAISDRASSIILAHNHPSGVLEASPDDMETTRRLIEAGKILGIEVLDHIVVSRDGYFSFKENGLIFFPDS